jgi:hypothetical protein
MKEFRKKIKKILFEFYLKEENKIFNNLILYRGEEKSFLSPKDNDYSFFAEDKSFAEDYGDYIWQCKFYPVNIFLSYSENSIHELYNNGYKLRDEYIEINWGIEGTSYEGVKDLYYYNENESIDNWGYKSAEDVIKSPFFASDTWEMIEHSEGVMDYILSKYDGVALLEGGQLTYYVRTDKIKSCKLIS